jgi:hypothetical protein
MNGAHKNFRLQGICVSAKSPMVEISISSLVNHINNVERIRYNGIPLEIPITKIRSCFLFKYNFMKFSDIFIDFFLLNTIIII